MIAKLNQYKEVITIAAFFLGGFAWIESQYPKRGDLEVLECLLMEYMTLTQQQIRAQDLEKQAIDLQARLADPHLASSETGLSPALRMVLDDQRTELGALRKELLTLERSMREIEDKLQRNSCGRLS